MSTRTKTAIGAMLLIGSASVAVAAYDGEGNRAPAGPHGIALIEPLPDEFATTFAARRFTPRVRRRQLDGDGNPVPGSR
jgi:hypothetical protein